MSNGIRGEATLLVLVTLGRGSTASECFSVLSLLLSVSGSLAATTYMYRFCRAVF